MQAVLNGTPGTHARRVWVALIEKADPQAVPVTPAAGTPRDLVRSAVDPSHARMSCPVEDIVLAALLVRSP
jgi:hypothetical protein